MAENNMEKVDIVYYRTCNVSGTISQL